MKKSHLLILASLPVAAAFAVLTPSYAFDHADAPATIADPSADITDVYAFMRPEGGKHLVLVMNFAPNATAGQLFDPQVDYTFYVRGISSDLSTLAAPSFKVICTFTPGTTQSMLCNINGSTHSTVVGDGADAGTLSSDVRLFAGLRSDPAFADVKAFQESVAARQNKFQTTGTNTFQGKNVRSIVVDFDVAKLVFNGDAGVSPIFAVSGETNRQ
jgi:hypothetical protein